MKNYSIQDNGSGRTETIGYLFCYEKTNDFIIELNSDLDEWQAPLLFQKYVHDGIFTIPQEASLMWVQERIIPVGRQNLGSILRQARLDEYNERILLALSKGKCAQDDCRVEEIAYADIPDEIKKRSAGNVSECFLTGEESLVCFFRDGVVRKISIRKLEKYEKNLAAVLSNRALLQTVKVDAGGYGISFDNVIRIPAKVLRNPEFAEEIVADDFKSFAKNGMVDTTKACEIMGCSRQNLSYLIQKGKLEPVINGTKENFFMRGSIRAE